MLAVRWNEDDWWPATVERVGAAVAGVKGAVPPDAIEVVYTDDSETRETIIRGSAVWKADVRCLGDEEQPLHDDKDVELLAGTEFMLESSEACVEEPVASKTVLIDAAEEDDEVVVSHDFDDEAYEPDGRGEVHDDHEVDGLIAEEILGDEEDKPEVKAPKPKKARPPSNKRRKQLLQAAASRWSVSSRLVNSGGVMLAMHRLPSKPKSANEQPDGGDDPPPQGGSFKRAIDSPAAAPPPRKRPNYRVPAPATPTVLSLLMSAPEKKPALADAPVPSSAIESAAAAAVAAVDLSLASSKKREARLLTMTAPSDLPSAAAAATVPTGDSVATSAAPSPSKAANARRAKPPVPSQATSSRLPPGWVAKWSERKQMYYYAHKAKCAHCPLSRRPTQFLRRLTRWTPPQGGEDERTVADSANHDLRNAKLARSDSNASSKQRDYDLSVEPQYTPAEYKPLDHQPQADWALDAAKRTMVRLFTIARVQTIRRPRWKRPCLVMVAVRDRQLLAGNVAIVPSRKPGAMI